MRSTFQDLVGCSLARTSDACMMLDVRECVHEKNASAATAVHFQSYFNQILEQHDYRWALNGIALFVVPYALSAG
jgi:hypothetical protein